MSVTPDRPNRLLKKGLSVLLVTSLVFAPGTSAALLASSPLAAVGALTVASDPADAAVYLDGQFVGRTPLALDDVEVGDHRIRVVKPGFLENSRVVGVAVGDANAVEVRLTPYAESAEDSAAAAQLTGEGGLFSNKFFLLGLAGGAIGLTVWALNRNSAPVIAGVGAAPAVGLAAATLVTLTAQGVSDDDGDSLSYRWEFGDGATADTSDGMVTHTYSSAGEYTATVTVSDGSESASASTMVSIRSLSGTWGGLLGQAQVPSTVMLTQNGMNLSGTFSAIGLSGPVSGTVSATQPRVTFEVAVAGFQPFTFTGDVSGDLNTLSGVINGSGFDNFPWTLTR